ncbi:molybdenum cofactor guanylyltransferase MobA [Paracoccus aerodenitrificans]|uniref:molybdenum cofactor guanylyltransferase MobA n=1 Tax=Paracoccus aerodenitrificans TaxID=3017781 RepID=UPI0022F13FC1|nr:molybdenum cofactor guanylyltransferase MobA [Paracoccus aerodenitrificans]WBU65541.1 molybdenum cofactor guanylyltransferase MobA [Paracoccus aerodenitrificans]
MDRTLPPAIILAGGRSSRMGGGDKVLLLLNGRPLITHVLHRMRPQAGAMAISANGDTARFDGFGLPVLPDPMPDFPGPLAGILAGMDWAAKMGANALVSVPGDTPFLPEGLVDGLRGAAGPSGLALAADLDETRTLRLHPTVALWPVALREDLRLALKQEQRRVRQFAAQHDHATALFDAPGAFFNINRPEDLAEAQQKD